MNLRGRCLCGTVSYEFDGDPICVFLCHCHDCQQSSGSLVHFGLMVPESGFTRRGELRGYESKGDLGRRVTREFCPNCGSGINNRLELAPGAVVIKAGTLDDPSVIQPTFEVYSESKAPFMTSADGIQSFDRELTADPQTVMWKPS